MNRSFVTTAVIVAAILAATLPVVGMRRALDAHATSTAQATLSDVAVRTVTHVDGVLSEAADALARAAPEAAKLCGIDERQRLAQIVQDAVWVRNIVVLDGDGRAVCAANELPVERLDTGAWRPARDRNLALAVMRGGARQALALRLRVADRFVVATLPPDAHRSDILPTQWQASVAGAMALDDGSVLTQIPPAGRGDPPDISGRVLSTERRSERFPIGVAMALPVATVAQGMSSLTMLVNVGGGAVGFCFLVLVIHAVRRPRTLDDAMRWAMRRNEFVPFFQPVLDIRSGALVGCEVLIRWVRRDGTVVPPALFIEQAEESGLAIPITRQLMCNTRDAVGAVYAVRPDLKLAFNLFADHFLDLSTMEDVREIFRDGGVRYGQLVFEVTERYPLPNLNRAKVAISALQELGCRVALDDAGTGHGGLAYLQKLGMDQIKIDKVFIDAITATSTAAPIVDSLVDLGRSLGMSVVAEGVETPEQLAYLRKRGVPFAQGYLFAKPLPAKEYIRLIEAMAPVAEELRAAA